MRKRRLRDLPPEALDGRRALVRVDFNVPLKDGRVADETRLKAALPTIEYLRDKGARVVLLSHLGRPKGPDPKLSLQLITRDLERLLGTPVEFIPDPHTGAAATRRLPRGGVALIENTRFWPGEEANDPTLAATFATLGDLYVNDAFGSAHRAHASTEAVAHLLKPAVAGFLMERELRYLGDALDQPRRPFLAVLGGAKISGKIDVITALLGKVDRLVIGGAMMFTFLRAQGQPTGRSLVEEDRIDAARGPQRRSALRRRRDGQDRWRPLRPELVRGGRLSRADDSGHHAWRPGGRGGHGRTQGDRRDPRRGGRPIPGLESGATFTIRPRTGMLVVFPGWLQHYVHPYRGTRPRIAIACNVTMSPMERRSHVRPSLGISQA